MIGWRARLGFLLPPGNPTVEPEMIVLAPQGVSLHFHRMTAHGATGSLEGQDERNRMMVDNIDSSIELLAMVSPRCHRHSPYRDELLPWSPGRIRSSRPAAAIDRKAGSHRIRLSRASIAEA